MAKEDKSKEEKVVKKKNWRDVVSSRNPDLNMDDDEAVASWMEESFNASDRADQERRQLNDLLTSDPMAAGILTGLSSGVDDNGEPFSLVAYLLDNYYDEIQGVQSKEEAVEKARKREAEQLKRTAEEEKRKKKSAENLKASDEALTEAMNEANMDEANVSAMLSWLYGEKDKENGFVYRIVRNEITKDDWKKLLYSFNREKELETAKKDGARDSRARSGKPQRSFRDEMPADLGGGGSMAGDANMEDPTMQRYRGMKRKYN